MDFKALITKLETIEKREVLTESEDRPAAKKKETTWTDKSGKKHPATQVQGSKSVAADKEADKERKKHDKELDEMIIKGAIAQELLKEFNIAFEEAEEEVDEAGPVMTRSDNEIWWDQNFPGQPFPGEAAAEKAYNDRMAAGQKNLDAIKGFFGGGKKPDAGAATKPAAAAPAAAPTGTQVQTDDEGNHMITTPDGKTIVVGPDGKPLPNGGKADAGGAATKPAAVDPAVAATREKFKALMDKLEKTGGVSGAAAAPAAAAGAATKPAAKKPAAGAATKPAGAPAASQPDWGAIGASQMTAEASLADDQILALIKSM